MDVAALNGKIQAAAVPLFAAGDFGIRCALLVPNSQTAPAESGHRADRGVDNPSIYVERVHIESHLFRLGAIHAFSGARCGNGPRIDPVAGSCCDVGFVCVCLCTGTFWPLWGPIADMCPDGPSFSRRPQCRCTARSWKTGSRGAVSCHCREAAPFRAAPWIAYCHRAAVEPAPTGRMR